MKTSPKDITTYKDVCEIVDNQYNQLLNHPVASRHFKTLNLNEHLPRIYNFWSFILEVDSINHSYKGSAFEPHVRLNLTQEDFEIWQQCLKNAVLGNFEGETAVKMLNKAEQLGVMFQYKLGILKIEE
jgi:truncated hemoglobin YjbI